MSKLSPVGAVVSKMGEIVRFGPAELGIMSSPPVRHHGHIFHAAETPIDKSTQSLLMLKYIFYTI